MALAGTLKDFSLADIFQLIGLQKKTGVLTLENEKEEARILFMNGLVVGADTNSQKLENRLGHVLVKSNRISQDELDQALADQRKTLQRLGQVLIQKGFIKPEDLRESLQTQTTQIIYRLFRWIDGSYNFQQEKFVDYDQENFAPVTSESILMEGVRMLDEWPMIEEVIPDFEVLVERTEAGKNIKLQMEKNFSMESAAGESFDAVLEGVLSDGPDPGIMEDSGPKLSHYQEIILSLISGPSIVQDLIDRGGFNEFDTCRAIYDMIGMDLIKLVTSDDGDIDAPVLEEEHQIPLWIPASLVAVIAAFSFFVSWNPLNKFLPMPHTLMSSETQFLGSTGYQIHKISESLDYYYLLKGSLPPSLGVLSRRQLLNEEAFLDPLGREYHYEIIGNESHYRLFGLNREGLRLPRSLAKEKVFAAGSAE